MKKSNNESSTEYNPEDSTEYSIEINSIKEDIKNLAKRLASLKQEALKSLYENTEEWHTALREIKNKIIKNEKNYLKNARSYVEEKPIQSVLGCFIGGVILGILLRK